jgi:hypothetical protein
MEQGTIKTLELLAEDNEMLRQEMASLVTAMNKMADIVADIATVGQKLKGDWEKVRNDMHPNNEASEDIQ